MVNLDLCCIHLVKQMLGTFIVQPYGITYTYVMKRT